VKHHIHPSSGSSDITLEAYRSRAHPEISYYNANFFRFPLLHYPAKVDHLPDARFLDRAFALAVIHHLTERLNFLFICFSISISRSTCTLEIFCLFSSRQYHCTKSLGLSRVLYHIPTPPNDLRDHCKTTSHACLRCFHPKVFFHPIPHKLYKLLNK
jgi:hypothetical protein